MKSLLLLALLAGPALAAEKTASKDDIELTEAVLKRDVADLPPAVMEAFVKVDVKTLPAKYRKKAEAKQVELHTLRRLGEGKKRGMLRWPEKDCAMPTESQSNEAQVLLMAGYEEISGSDLNCVMERTKCTERALMCEFSLNEIIETKKGKKSWRFFFHTRDPIMVIVARCQKGTTEDNNFFGGAKPECQ